MAIAEVQAPSTDNIASGTSDTLAYGSSVSAGSLLIMAIRVGADKVFTVSDDVNGAWSTAVTRVLASHGEVGIFYFPNAAGGTTTVSVSLDGGATSIRWSIHEYSGAATASVVDQTATADGTLAASNDGPDVTTTSDGQLLFAVVGSNALDTFTAGTGWALQSEVPAAPGTRMFTQDRVSDTGTYSADFASAGTSGQTWVAAVATFKAATGGGGSILRQMIQHHQGRQTFRRRHERGRIFVPQFDELLRYGKRAA